MRAAVTGSASASSSSTPTTERTAVAQFAYKMEAASQGRGISALVALNADAFLVLERNNRGIGVGADATPPNKKVFRISLANATDVSGVIFLSNTDCPSVTKNPTPFLDLGANTLPALGNRVPEKWEGLAIGPRLRDDEHRPRYVVLAGTDNDYSVTQNGSGTQFDVYFKLQPPSRTLHTTPISIQSSVRSGRSTSVSSPTGGAPARLTKDFDLLPGVLHAYKVLATDLGNYIPPPPQP